jgi:DNA ligase (NAD+)
MDIEGLGDKLVNQLVESNLVQTYGDLYRLTAESLCRLERMGKRSSEKLIEAIEASKSQSLDRFLTALSIRHVGTTVAKILAKNFPSIEAIAAASVDELNAIDEIGGIIAQSIHDFFRSEFGQNTLDDFQSLGLAFQPLAKKTVAVSDILNGKSLVVTGTLQKYTREKIHQLIEQFGGKPSSSVSSKTSYLIAGADAGSKLDKAEKLGIKVLNETEFEELIGI